MAEVPRLTENTPAAKLQQSRPRVEQAQRRQQGIILRAVTYVVTALLVLLCMWKLSNVLIHLNPAEQDKPEGASLRLRGRVPMEAHIMSKCPDARDCLHDLVLPAMQLASEDVDFTLSYIGSETHDDDGVLCKHGAGECVGNMIELCAAHLYPDPKIYLGFVMCMTREYQDIPDKDLIEDCALEHGVAVDRLNHCALDVDGTVGLELLQASFNRSNAAGVTKSCTIRLDERVRCIRDDGEWKDCPGGHNVADLLRDIRESVV